MEEITNRNDKRLKTQWINSSVKQSSFLCQPETNRKEWQFSGRVIFEPTSKDSDTMGSDNTALQFNKNIPNIGRSSIRPNTLKKSA